MQKRVLLIVIAMTGIFLQAGWGKSVLVLGDIGTYEASKMEYLNPLGDYLVNHLKELNITKFQVVITPSQQEMAHLFNKEAIDLFIDSPYPTLTVQHLASTHLMLRRWKKGVSQYHTVIFTLKESPLNSLQDLIGHRIAFDSKSSTSGYLLPKYSLLNQGISLNQLPDLQAPIAPHSANYLFSEGDTTTLMWVRHKMVLAGATDNVNYQEFSLQTNRIFKILHETVSVPRQIVSYRKNLDPALVAKIKHVLETMHQSIEGQQILQNFEQTTKFDALSEEDFKVLENLRKIISKEF